MKTIIKFIMLMLLTSMTGCFLLNSTSTSSSTQTASTNASSTSQSQTNLQLLTKRWSLQQVYQVANAQISNSKDRRNSSSWMTFYSSGALYENGLLGTDGRQQLHWSVTGNMITIQGNNITYADGNLSGSEVKYTIVSISESQLHLCRWDGRTPNGADIIRHLIFKAY